MAETVANYFSTLFDEVSPRDYYDSLFPIGSLERKGEYKTGEYCAIAIQINQETGQTRRIHVTDGLPQLDDLLESDEFVIMAPMSFIGKNATNKNSRFLFALQFDLDFLRVTDGKQEGAKNLLYQMSLAGYQDPLNRLPKPTYLIATSDNNCHVVYLLERPVAMYENVVSQVREFRKSFIPKLWDSWITTAYEQPQFETSPAHAFRLVGSWDKTHSTRTRCFKVGERVTIEELNKYVPDEARITSIRYKSKLTLEQAKEQFPDWYERRVEGKQPPYTFKAHRGLYDWLKNQSDSIKVGHRYFYMVCLCAFAIKCDISEDELMHDLTQIRTKLDMLSPPDNPLTMSDLVKAAQSFSEDSRFMKRETTSRLCGIEIQPSKRNRRKQKTHLAIARATKQVLKEAGELKKEGRPSKKDLILDYAAKHPKESNREIVANLGVSRTTVNKWLKCQQENEQ